MGGGTGEVEALAQSTKGRRSASKLRIRHEKRDASSHRRCRYCDGHHGESKESCPAYGQKCRKCSKLHHFAKVCKSSGSLTANTHSKHRDVCQIDGEELLALHATDKKRAYCNLKVEGRSVKFLLDCGATVNVLPLEDAAAINPKLTAVVVLLINQLV